MPPKTVPPSHLAASFTCPHCGALAQQSWWESGWSLLSVTEDVEPEVLNASVCGACHGLAVWRSIERRTRDDFRYMTWVQIFPLKRQDTEPLSSEAPEAVRELWEEARAVAPHSSRSAAALLRLALQTLLVDLQPDESNLNAAIGKVLRGGLDETVQQSMDILRIGGNGAVHPGEVRLDDDPATLDLLFGLLSYIVEETYVRRANITSLYNRLPEEKRAQIAKRDQRPAPPLEPS